MTRPLRIEYDDAYYHVMNRGRDKGRQKIFHSTTFYEEFLTTLVEACERFGLVVHAYCLMSNHYHLLVQTPKGNLSRAMRHINGVYTQRYNRLTSSDGPLFRGRYKALLVDKDSYLLQLSRYIHRNPIETKRPMVEKLEDYRWSSYPAYVNKAPCPDWLNREQIYGMLGKKNKFQGYRQYVAQENTEEITRFYNRGNTASVIGDKDYIAWLREDKIPELEDKRIIQQVISKELQLKTLIGLIAKFYKVSSEEITQLSRGYKQKKQIRKIAMFICQQLGGYSLKEIMEAFNLTNIGSVSYATTMVRKELNENKRFNREIEKLKAFIMEKVT